MRLKHSKTRYNDTIWNRYDIENNTVIVELMVIQGHDFNTIYSQLNTLFYKTYGVSYDKELKRHRELERKVYIYGKDQMGAIKGWEDDKFLIESCNNNDERIEDWLFFHEFELM